MIGMTWNSWPHIWQIETHKMYHINRMNTERRVLSPEAETMSDNQVDNDQLESFRAVSLSRPRKSLCTTLTARKSRWIFNSTNMFWTYSYKGWTIRRVWLLLLQWLFHSPDEAGNHNILKSLLHAHLHINMKTLKHIFVNLRKTKRQLSLLQLKEKIWCGGEIIHPYFNTSYRGDSDWQNRLA